MASNKEIGLMILLFEKISKSMTKKIIAYVLLFCKEKAIFDLLPIYCGPNSPEDRILRGFGLPIVPNNVGCAAFLFTKD